MFGVLGILAIPLVPLCVIYGYLVYVSFDGELDDENNRPVYVAKDEASFRILQQLPAADEERLKQAERQTNRRILAIGSGTLVRIKSELYFDGGGFRSGFLLSSERKHRMLRVYRVLIRKGSLAGQLVFVPAERFHNYAYF